MCVTENAKEFPQQGFLQNVKRLQNWYQGAIFGRNGKLEMCG